MNEPVLAVTAPPLPEFPAPQIAEPAPVRQPAPAPELVIEQQATEAQAPAPYEPLPPVMPAFEPKAEPKTEPKAEPKAELDQSGLVLIETDPSKARTVQLETEQPHTLGRARRERKPQPAEAEPELVQIETRK